MPSTFNADAAGMLSISMLGPTSRVNYYMRGPTSRVFGRLLFSLTPNEPRKIFVINRGRNSKKKKPCSVRLGCSRLLGLGWGIGAAIRTSLWHHKKTHQPQIRTYTAKHSKIKNTIF